jgi:hypothetical protein
MTDRSLVVALLMAIAGCATPQPSMDAGARADALASVDASGPEDAPVVALDAPAADAPTLGPDAAMGPFEGCPADALRIDAVYGDTAIDTGTYGEFGNNIMVVRFTVPTTASGARVRSSSWAEYIGGRTVRMSAFSTRPCDFSAASALRSSTGAAFVTNSGSLTIAYNYTLGPATATAASLTPGETYYINALNQFPDGSPSCTIADCRMRGTLPL